MTSKIGVIPLLLTFFLPGALAEDTPATICKNAAELYEEGDLDGAIEEAKWCIELLEKEQQGKTLTFFHDEINDYKGGELTKQQSMGINMVERVYTKDGKSIKVSLTDGAGSSMMDAFSEIAKMGMEYGEGEKIRIQKRTGMNTSKPGHAQLSVNLKRGGILSFESNDLPDTEVLIFAKAFPIADLDESRTR